jgi:hypothetical protein
VSLKDDVNAIPTKSQLLASFVSEQQPSSQTDVRDIPRSALIQDARALRAHRLWTVQKGLITRSPTVDIPEFNIRHQFEVNVT